MFLVARHRWLLVASALTLVAAGFTRQTALIAPLAVTMTLAVNDRRALAWFLIPYGAAGLMALGSMQWLTHGEFWRHVVVST